MRSETTHGHLLSAGSFRLGGGVRPPTPDFENCWSPSVHNPTSPAPAHGAVIPELGGAEPAVPTTRHPTPTLNRGRRKPWENY
ncbi:hypothetical protein GN956_G26078 [Arapaima gigas]